MRSHNSETVMIIIIIIIIIHNQNNDNNHNIKQFNRSKGRNVKVKHFTGSTDD